MESKDILTKIGHDAGMTVPEGYFADFAKRMEASLPEQPWEKEISSGEPVILPPRTLWQRVRPYVYLAAMFAGIWCMMQIFGVATPQSPDRMISSNPVLAEALVNADYVEDLGLEESDWDTMMDDMYDKGVKPSDIKAVALSSTRDIFDDEDEI